MKSNKTSKILYQETQRFTQWWIWLILLTAFIWGVVDISMNLFEKETISNADIWGSVIYVVTFVPVFLLFIASRLQTEISTEGVFTRFFPFKRSSFYEWNELEKVYVRKYRPIFEYGGWGWRGINNNKALNISGNWGLQLEFKNGKKLLIGTKNPEEMEKVSKNLKV